MRARLIGTFSNLVERGCGRNVGPARGGREDLSPSPYNPRSSQEERRSGRAKRAERSDGGP